MTVLASGSKGNSTVISSSRTRILVDAGLSCRELFKRMQAVGEDPWTLDAILITHEHQDHVQGLSVAARRLGIPVYFTEATHRAWRRWMTPRKRITMAEWLARQKEARLRQESAASEAASSPEAAPDPPPGAPLASDPGPTDDPAHRLPELAASAGEDDAAEPETPADTPNDPCALPGVEYFCAGTPFVIGDIDITPFTIPHDAIDPVGFVFQVEGVRMAIATDLGYIPSNVQLHLRRADVLMLESNHDLDMLRDGPYPWSVKQRVLSRVGHLSNDAAADFLERTYDGRATYVILAHLSESNNLPALARVAAERALRDRVNLLGNRLLLAPQREPMSAICL